VVTPEQAAKYSHDLWAAYAPTLSPVVDVNLPRAIQDRFKVFFDGLALADIYPIPDWVMRLYAVQDALTAVYYHQQRIAEIEAKVIQAGSDAIADVGVLPTRLNSHISTRTLSYEYQAFLFDYRRSFEYVSIGIAGAFDVTAPKHSRDLPSELQTAPPKYQPDVPAMVAKLAEVAKRFKKVLGKASPRNTTAHHEPVSAGEIRLWLEPGREPHIALENGGEELPMRDFGGGTGLRLAVILEDQLNALADAIFELLNLLPRPAAGLDIPRLSR
jgi:hypothetical protein